MSIITLKAVDVYFFRNPGSWTFYTGSEGGGGDGTGYCGRGGGAADRYWFAARFRLTHPIPPKAVIWSAIPSIFCHADLWQWDATDYLRWYVQDIRNATQKTGASDRPSADGGNTTLYPSTLANGVRWPASGGLSVTTDARNTSVNVASLIQQIVNAYDGLAAGSHVELWMTEDALAGANNISQVPIYSLEKGVGYEPHLTINYSDRRMSPKRGYSAVY